MKLGVLIWPQYTDFDSLRAIGVRADELGYDSIWTWDHFFPLYGDSDGAHAAGEERRHRQQRVDRGLHLAAFEHRLEPGAHVTGPGPRPAHRTRAPPSATAAEQIRKDPGPLPGYSGDWWIEQNRTPDQLKRFHAATALARKLGEEGNLDALVKDKKTNLPIPNLTPENFQVLDDGKPRNISYFTREGQARKPLALILILDLREDGAGRFLKRTEILKAMEDELAKLPPGDEVAILALDLFEDEERLWLTDFTNDRAKLATALARVPALCVGAGGSPERTSTVEKNTQGGEGKPEDIVETETIRGRNGATVTREIRRDGRTFRRRARRAARGAHPIRGRGAAQGAGPRPAGLRLGQVGPALLPSRPAGRG